VYFGKNRRAIHTGQGYELFSKVQPLSLMKNYLWSLIEGSINELRSTRHITSSFDVVSRSVVIALLYLVKSAIFETTAFSVASIVGYLIVYRWFRKWEDSYKIGTITKIIRLIMTLLYGKRKPPSAEKFWETSSQDNCNRLNQQDVCDFFIICV
jgi:hypothetical protein